MCEELVALSDIMRAQVGGVVVMGVCKMGVWKMPACEMFGL